MISKEAIITRNDTVLFSVVDDVVVMMDIATGTYHDLDGIGSRVWLLLDPPRSVAEICRILVEEFEIDLPACEADVAAFVDDLRARGVVTVA